MDSQARNAPLVELSHGPEFHGWPREGETAKTTLWRGQAFSDVHRIFMVMNVTKCLPQIAGDGDLKKLLKFFVRNGLEMQRFHL